MDEGAGLEEITAALGISARQFRRIVQKELGVAPIELLQTRRLLLAKQLLTETRLPIIEVAFASGFSSLRRFNDAFSSRYCMPPSRLRKEAATENTVATTNDTSTLQLSYRPPYDWEKILEFLKTRQVKEVESVTGDGYARTIRFGRHTGWIRVTHAGAKRALMVEFTHSLTVVLPALLGRLRHLFDLTARPDQIAAHLMTDKRLAPSVKKYPGLRVPGAFDGFETAVRAVLGQQVTVKAATTLAGRFVEAFGEKLATPFPELTRLSPTAFRVAKASVDEISPLGIISARASSIIALARTAVSGALRFDPGAHSETAINQLLAIPGIGPWTAQYIAMRAMHWPDAFPKEDIAVRNNLGGISARKAEEMSRAWSPWRSYAVMHIWARGAMAAD